MPNVSISCSQFSPFPQRTNQLTEMTIYALRHICPGKCPLTSRKLASYCRANQGSWILITVFALTKLVRANKTIDFDFEKSTIL